MTTITAEERAAWRKSMQPRYKGVAYLEGQHVLRLLDALEEAEQHLADTQALAADSIHMQCLIEAVRENAREATARAEKAEAERYVLRNAVAQEWCPLHISACQDVIRPAAGKECGLLDRLGCIEKWAAVEAQRSVSPASHNDRCVSKNAKNERQSGGEGK